MRSLLARLLSVLIVCLLLAGCAVESPLDRVATTPDMVCIPTETTAGTQPAATGHVHDYIVTVVPPTCTQEGYTIHECLCRDKYVDNYTDILPHIYTIQQLPPTETEEACILYTCTRCGLQTKEPVHAQAVDADHVHDFASFQIVEPTCTQEGYTLRICTCGETTKDTFLAPRGHRYEKETLPPNCVAEGYDLYTCSVCGLTYQDNFVPPEGHRVVASASAPTCSIQGYTRRVCQICGDETRDEFTPAKHTMKSVGTDGQFDKYVCTICGTAGYVPINTPACYHEFQLEKHDPATCTQDGTSHFRCKKCQASYTLSHPASHDYREAKIAPTQDQQGFTRHTCVACGHFYDDEYTDPTGN